METTVITRADAAPRHLQRAAKAALAVGASVMANSDGEGLMVQFKESDRYYFDPENVTLHALEMLGHARTYGFVVYSGTAADAWIRVPLVIRTVFSNEDVRVQLGASKWFADKHANTATAMRHALVDAFATYYDEAIAPAQA